jgi:ATP-dependent Lon protease
MHVPEGATPKDGPSAGIAMVTSMLSLAMEKPISNDLAMTGEISLTGKVLPVGGIKEKIMGGRRAGIKSIILPMANQRDYDEIPEYLKEGLEVYFADDYDKVYEVAFGPFKKSVKA